MSWFKSIGSGLAVAVLGFLAFMAAVKASREKASAKKWKNRAVEEQESGVDGSVTRANQALTQAKLADNKAKAARKKTREKLDAIAARDETMADITNRWRNPK